MARVTQAPLLHRGWPFAWAVSLTLFAGPAFPAADSSSRNLVVDCLLPGEVRKLGGTMTYMSPRRPIKSTTQECEVLGGEYVAYDRANAQTALAIWMQGAAGGDAEAMAYVGVIYEKGIGQLPDYTKAAEWYQKAVDAGSTRAMSNLAYLYEQGLGVPRDGTKALNLYRQAAGIKDNDLIFQADADAVMLVAQKQIEDLISELETQNRESQQLRESLNSTQKQLVSRKAALAQARGEIEALQQQAHVTQAQPVNEQRLAQLRQLELNLNVREAALQRQLKDIADLERKGSDEEAKLAQQLKSSTDRDKALQQALGKATAEAQTAKAQLAGAQARLTEMESQLARLTAQLTQERATINAERARLDRQAAAATSGASTEIKTMRGELHARENLLAQQSAIIATLQAEKSVNAQRVAQMQAEQQRLEKETRSAQTQQQLEASAARAQIASLEQKLLLTQQQAAQHTSQLETDRARIAAERDQLQRRKNAVSEAQRLEVERFTQELAQKEGQLLRQRSEIAALEAESKEYSVEIARLRQQQSAAPPTQLAMRSSATSVNPELTKPRRISANLDLGQFHALLIGNDRYESLASLETAVNDVQAVSAVLTKRYGFKTRILINATRDQMLDALNEYRLKLKEKDSLLIYYAGHGELDRQNLRGYWLPVDARRDSNTRWISDQMVTDQIGLMAARHVLVVADSCYSGVMTRSTGVRLLAKGGDSAETKRLITLAKLPSRTVLTSGGEKPVLDTGGGANSIFARAFIDALSRNDGVLEGTALHSALFDPVKKAAAAFKVDQSPRYAVLADTKHRNGEFLFIPEA